MQETPFAVGADSGSTRILAGNSIIHTSLMTRARTKASPIVFVISARRTSEMPGSVAARLAPRIGPATSVPAASAGPDVGFTTTGTPVMRNWNSMPVVANRTHVAGSPEAVRIVRAWADHERRCRVTREVERAKHRDSRAPKPKGEMRGIGLVAPRFLNSYGRMK